MKKLKELGRSLSREEQKNITGGTIPANCFGCQFSMTAACISQGNDAPGCASIANAWCSYHGYCPPQP